MLIFITGNGNISFNHFMSEYVPKINACINDEFIIGDFRGTDVLTMEYLKDKTEKVTILHQFDSPRYLPDSFKTKVSKWKKVGMFENDSKRDEYAINECDYIIGSDFNSDEKRESGTLKNIKKAIQLNKKHL